MSINKYDSSTQNLIRIDGYSVDENPTSGSSRPVSSGGVYTALNNITNVQSDWNQNDPAANDYIKNKPDIPGKSLEEVTVMPENPTDGQLVIWNGNADYTKGHTYKYDENKEEWVDIIENYIYDADWTSQGDISFNGRQAFHGHTTFTSNTGTTEFEGDVSFDPIYDTSEGSVYINTPIIINNSVNPSSNYWAIDESGNATFSSINVGTIYATNITMENYNGQIDMYGNDIIGVGSITGDAGNSIGLDASVVISGNLSVSNDLDISGDLSVSGTITDGSGNSLVYDNDSRLSDAREPLSHEHTVNDITDFPAYGTTSGTICEGNDSRLSNARTPVAHTHSSNDITFPTWTKIGEITGTSANYYENSTTFNLSNLRNKEILMIFSVDEGALTGRQGVITLTYSPFEFNKILEYSVQEEDEITRLWKGFYGGAPRQSVATFEEFLRGLGYIYIATHSTTAEIGAKIYGSYNWYLEIYTR